MIETLRTPDERFENLPGFAFAPHYVDDVPGYRYEGVAGTTDWVPFDQSRADLAFQIVEYARVEAEGGIPYTFSDGAGGHLTAAEAIERYQATGGSPLSKWQMHLFRRV